MQQTTRLHGVANRPGGTKTLTIAGSIRRQILSGELKPGDTLPVRAQLLKRYSVSNETLQRAANILLEDGYLEASRGVGTKVALYPPHLYRFAVVVPATLAGFESLLWKTVRQLAPNLDVGAHRNLRMYYGGLNSLNSDDRRLIADVQDDRVGGILFTTNHARFLNTPVLSIGGLPRVVWSGMPDQDPARVPSAVWFDYPSLVETAMVEFGRQGRKRIAVVAAGASLGFAESTLNEALARIGAVCPTRWRLFVHAAKSQAARNIVQLLMYGAPEARPDGLLILDDNLETDVLLGLQSAGVRVPDDLFVICHANFPTVTPPPLLPICRMGFNIADMLRLSIESLVRMRAGEPVPRFESIKAVRSG